MAMAPIATRLMMPLSPQNLIQSTLRLSRLSLQLPSRQTLQPCPRHRFLHRWKATCPLIPPRLQCKKPPTAFQESAITAVTSW